MDPSPFHIQVLACDFRTIDRNWGTQEHCDPYWRLYVNKRPGAYLTLGNRRYDILPNRIHLIPAWVRLRCHSGSTTEHFFIHFNVIGLSMPILQDTVPGPVVLAGRTDYDTIARSFRCRGSSDLHRTFHRVMSAQSIVCRALDGLCADLPVEKLRRLTSAPFDEGRIAAVLRYIESHLEQRLDNAVLARMARLSKGRFIRGFNHVVGQTPARYVTERRIAAAAERLTLGDNSLEQIAAVTGFSNRFYFTRVFGRLMGVSPAQYRRIGLSH